MSTTEFPPSNQTKTVTFYPDKDSAQQPTPLERVTINPPLIQVDLTPQHADDILIKAQPSRLGDECRFMVNKPLLDGYSWWFTDANAGESSALVDAIFALGAIEKVLLHETTLTVVKMYNDERDWQALGAQIGQIIREQLQSGQPILSPEITRHFLSEAELTTEILALIDTQINPGVAAHEGECTLEKIAGNTVYIQMGGGCQGCSSAGATLKYGIETVFRENIPYLGAVFDETDHAAGVNPYFS